MISLHFGYRTLLNSINMRSKSLFSVIDCLAATYLWFSISTAMTCTVSALIKWIMLHRHQQLTTPITLSY